MKYSYQDFPDKTKEGINKELENGLTTAAVYFHQSLGIPLEVFNEWIEKKTPTKAHQMNWYLNFRNSHPKLYETR